MSDLVERLRTGTTKGTALTWTVTAIHTEAAARITALEAQVAAADRLSSAIDHGSSPSVIRKLSAAYRAAKGE